jgi:hypothetical protein
LISAWQLGAQKPLRSPGTDTLDFCPEKFKGKMDTTIQQSKFWLGLEFSVVMVQRKASFDAINAAGRSL